MGLIKFLLSFYPPCLDYLQERPKHGLDRHFIHKSVEKCDIIMQNCRLINDDKIDMGPLIYEPISDLSVDIQNLEVENVILTLP